MKSAKVTSSHGFSTLKLHFPMAFQWLKRTEKRARKQRVQPGPTGSNRAFIPDHPRIIPSSIRIWLTNFQSAWMGPQGPRARNRLQDGAKKSNFTVLIRG